MTRAGLIALLLLGGCADDNNDGPKGEALSIEELLKPETCKECHAIHYREWKSSMHAYAAEDPVFRAMNELGQEATDGELGDFCVSCHAPMAVRGVPGVVEPQTTDGTNLDDVDEELQGVTCYFCHNVVDVTDEHNNPLVLANDQTMRAAIKDPVDGAAHFAEYSPLLDENDTRSAKVCGSCHDIVTPAPCNVALERTFTEWKDSVFSTAIGFNSCGSCHMNGRDGIAADAEGIEVKERRIHEHTFHGVDTALTEWPDTELQNAAIQTLLDSTLLTVLCPNPDGTFEVRLEANSGHKFPSGAGQDRRAWVEFVAYDENDDVIYSSPAIRDREFFDETGLIIADDEVVDREGDLWQMRDRIYDEHGDPTHNFWSTCGSDEYPDGYESTLLPYSKDFTQRHWDIREYRVFPAPARVAVRVRIRAIGLDVLDHLIDEKHLDPAIREAVPTFTLAFSHVEWVRDRDGYSDCFQKPVGEGLDYDYRCLIEPDSVECEDFQAR